MLNLAGSEWHFGNKLRPSHIPPVHQEYLQSLGAKIDINDKYGSTDNETHVNVNIFRNPKTNLFRVYRDEEEGDEEEFNKEPLYEIIPSGDSGSCLDLENLDKSKFANQWIVPKKQPKKYSIQKIYDE